MRRPANSDEEFMSRRSFKDALRCEAGLTLVELLMGAALGLLVLSTSLLVLDDSVKLARVTDQRVDAAQRGRDGMETMTRELRSQVCLDAAPPLTEAGDSSVSYYVNLNGLDATPERHQMALENGDLILRRYVPTGTPPTLTFPVNPTSTRTVVENVQPLTGTPVFRYYKWSSGTPAVPSTLLTTPLSAADRALSVKISIAFRVNPSREFRNDRAHAELSDSVFVRSERHDRHHPGTEMQLMRTLRARRARLRDAGDDRPDADPRDHHRGRADERADRQRVGAQGPGPQARLQRRRSRAEQLHVPAPARSSGLEQVHRACRERRSSATPGTAPAPTRAPGARSRRRHRSTPSS